MTDFLLQLLESLYKLGQVLGYMLLGMFFMLIIQSITEVSEEEFDEALGQLEQIDEG